MPIGTVDYVSAKPWNDAANPWPQYSRLMLSATDARLGSGVSLAYDMSSFYPAFINGEMAWIYTCTQTTYDDMFPQVQLSKLANDGAYEAQVIFDGDVQYQLGSTTRRGIPMGDVQGNHDWESVNGDDAATLSIMPVTTHLTPWEHRRRWALMG